LDQLIQQIQSANSIILTTHRQCDGDGLGAELALYFALKKMGKKVKVINVDQTPKKYHYLNPDTHIQYHDRQPAIPDEVDLVLIFDTNDERMLSPLFNDLIKKCDNLAFLDHHPVLKKGPQPTPLSWIDTSAASTGEMAYKIIKTLGVPLDREISRCLYTSITFDTQLYRFIRNSPNSHLIAAELLLHNINPEEIHRALFGNQTVHKMAFLARALGQIEYHCEGSLAILKIKDSDMFHYNLEPDDSRDVIDMVMNIESLEAAALFREDAPNEYKLSLRSKGHIEVLELAEAFDGGGHLFAAGAFIKGDFDTIKSKVVREMTKLLNTKKTAG
jgi:bifunctional oligoribonuclease and PAP phosphatase NrnA